MKTIYALAIDYPFADDHFITSITRRQPSKEIVGYNYASASISTPRRWQGIKAALKNKDELDEYRETNKPLILVEVYFCETDQIWKKVA